jgi:hypothetical protein
MLILVVMSLYSWTVILSKKKILLDSKRDIKDFSKYFSLAFFQTVFYILTFYIQDLVVVQ